MRNMDSIKCAARLQRDTRLQRACELLRQGTLNVSEVAYATGFASPDYFSRIFSREMGVPPSKYKENSQDGPEKRKTAIGCTEFFPG